MDERYLEHAERLTYALAEEEQARIRKKLAETAIPPDWDGCCSDCGETVPAQRVILTGSTLCAECKTEQEYRERFFRR